MENFPIVYIICVGTIFALCYYFGRKYPLIRKMSIVLFIFSQLFYLVWRSLYTLPSAGIISLIAGLTLLLTEWAGFSQNLVTSTLFWNKNKRVKQELPDFEKLPDVDILIATYNESVELLKRTIVSSQLIDYPKEKMSILVCDDGKREDVRILCETLGVRHVTRDTHEHAKAGNLNHALSVSDSEIVVTMDADMIPKSNFLKETIGYFSNERTAFVQAPQAFYNEDPFQYNLFAGDRISNEQDFFMRLIEEQKDQFNATMYVGSNALFRRSSLEKIGGFATGVITEDMATGMLIQAEGFDTVFVNEVIAIGLAPETYEDLLKQRDRWCRGNIQVMRKYNPLKSKGLSFMQKLLYIDGIHYWFFGLYKSVYLIAPVLYLVFGIIVLDADFYSLLMFWVPAFISSQLFAHLISDKKRTVMWSNVYDIALAPAMSWAIISELFFKKNMTFNVTRKGVYTNKRHFLWRASLFHMVLASLSTVGLVRGVLSYTSPSLVSLDADSLYINLFWTLYNIFGLLIVMLIFFERPRYRAAERFAKEIEALVRHGDTEIPVKLVDLSENGARLSVPDNQFNFKNDTILLKILDDIQLNCVIRWINKRENKEVILGVSFQGITDDHYRYIIDQLYSNPNSILGEKDYYRPGLISTALNFFKQTQKVPLSQHRLGLREQVRGNGILSSKQMNYSIQIVDLSLEGSQIRTRVKLSIGDQVSIDSPSENINSRMGEVKWVKKSLNTYTAGIKFS